MMPSFTDIEKAFIAKSGRSDAYPGERSLIVEVNNVYELGQLVAIAFLEWVVANPSGVIALPTGRTPEYFIKTLDRYRTHWGSPALVAELTGLGFIPNSTFPDMAQLTFVMLDEFFPISTEHRNSFCNYIRNFYCEPLGIPNERILDFDLISNGIITKDEMAVFSAINIDLSLLSTTHLLTEAEKKQREILVKIDGFCKDFEARVRALGGIGFFLGGIGPDGHIAFNQQGSALDSVTRLVGFNYPTAAAAAGDLGGIEKARGKAAMTIGLATIAYNKDAKAIIMAAGEGKAEVVRRTIEDKPSASNPGSKLQELVGARFYLTHGAASKLTARKAQDISKITVNCVSWALGHLSGVGVGLGIDLAHLVVPPQEYLLAESLIYDCSRKVGKPVHELRDASELNALPQSAHVPDWMKEPHNFLVMISCAARRLREKVDGGLRAASSISKSILHTAPHHDDIMLSYHGAMHEMLGRQPAGTLFAGTGGGLKKGHSSQLSLTSSNNSSASRDKLDETENLVAPLTLGETFNNNVNHFAYLTSGFHSVEDKVLTRLAEACMAPYSGKKESNVSFHANGTIFNKDASTETTLHNLVHSGELSRDYDELMAIFHDAFVRRDEEAKDEVESVIFLRKISEVWAIVPTQSYSQLVTQLTERVKWLLEDYLPNHHPGDATPEAMQLLKGCMRESEVDRVWALSKMPMNRIHHMRSKFYTDDFFCPMPSLEDDAMPFANLVRARKPELITVAFDPEGTGPDTHYKVLQVVAAGLKVAQSRGDLKGDHGPMVWGYRNVWFVFAPWECNVMIPASEEDLDLMHDTFMSCFSTQKEASFPSPMYDGPFSAWAKHLQVEQKKELEDLLGKQYFEQHADPRVRTASGFVFLKAMHTNTFLKECEGLKSKFEMV